MTDPATPEGRAELRRLCEAATPGEWARNVDARHPIYSGARNQKIAFVIAEGRHGQTLPPAEVAANLALIPAARNALPAALDLIEAQAVEIEALMDALPPAQELRSRTAASLRTILAAIPDHPDNARVDEFGAAMKVKLAKKRGEGRGGWDEPTVCTVDSLAAQLIDHLRKGDPVDVGNLAMMLFHRGGHDALARAAAFGTARPARQCLRSAAQSPASLGSRPSSRR